MSEGGKEKIVIWMFKGEKDACHHNIWRRQRRNSLKLVCQNKEKSLSLEHQTKKKKKHISNITQKKKEKRKSLKLVCQKKLTIWRSIKEEKNLNTHTSFKEENEEKACQYNQQFGFHYHWEKFLIWSTAYVTAPHCFIPPKTMSNNCCRKLKYYLKV